MSRILIVDDEERIRKIIQKYAEMEGFESDQAEDGYSAINMAGRNIYDLIILDIMMPGMDGFTVCSNIRKTMDIPIIMLSAKGEEYDRIHGFEVGADDYVVKPFSPKELMMRIKAVLTRSSDTKGEKAVGKKDVFVLEGLKVDFSSRIVYVDDKRMEMTPKEYDLLFYLIRNRGLALAREKILTGVWGYDYYGDDRTLDTHIKVLRKSLGPYRKHLVTLRGLGYRFE